MSNSFWNGAGNGGWGRTAATPGFVTTQPSPSIGTHYTTTPSGSSFMQRTQPGFAKPHSPGGSPGGAGPGSWFTGGHRQGADPWKGGGSASGGVPTAPVTIDVSPPDVAATGLVPSTGGGGGGGGLAPGEGGGGGEEPVTVAGTTMPRWLWVVLAAAVLGGGYYAYRRYKRGKGGPKSNPRARKGKR